MRTTTLLKKLLGIQHLVVDDFRLDGLALMVDVHPTWRRPRCPICHRIVPGYDRLPVRLWRHLDFAGTQVLLRYARRRVACPVCGIHVEEVPWSDGAESRFTHAFEESVAFLAQCTDKTSVLEVFRISWVTVGKIIERVVGRHRPEDPLDGLTAIGVDELSYRKGHQYVTLVTDHATGRIVWGKKGKNAETFMSFFKALGEERCKAIRVVTNGHERCIPEGGPGEGPPGPDRVRPIPCPETRLLGPDGNTTGAVENPEGAGAGTSEEDQRAPLGTTEETLESHPQAAESTLNATARQRSRVSSLSPEGVLRCHPGSPPAQRGGLQAEGLADMGEPQPSARIRPGRKDHGCRSSQVTLPLPIWVKDPVHRAVSVVGWPCAGTQPASRYARS